MSIRELHVSRGFYGAETLPLTADDLGAVPAALGAETGNRNDTAEIDALRQGLKSSDEGAVENATARLTAYPPTCRTRR